ncbi:MAG TPA: glycosyltransferase [Vicinamibacterales bacterium]|nr:glycosyltransferase [Vicinamibacterales bacterium]
MARVVLTCWGSHGDIDPFLGLGLALRSRNHDVCIATIEYYRELVESAGLAFHAIRPRIEPTETPLIERIMDLRRGSEFLLKEVLFPAIEAMYDDIAAAAAGADLLVSHPVTFATPIVAERLRLPWASAVLAPTSMFSVFDYPAVPPAPWVKHLQRFGSWPGRIIVGVARRETRKWSAPIDSFRHRLGLPRGANPVLEGQHSPHLVLALYSRVLGEPQPDWPPHVTVTGHVFYDAPHGTALAPHLDAFLQGGPPPLVFTLGSSVVMIATDFWRESVEATRRLGARAVLLAGPDRAAPLEALLQREHGRGPRDIIAVERAPHSLLFPRAAVVIQQCGIGTLAQSLRSGRPMLAVPYSHDQPDNAWRARHLGMARVLYPARFTAARAAAHLRRLLDDGHYGTAASRVAEAVRAERGAAAACDAIERTFALGPTHG